MSDPEPAQQTMFDPMIGVERVPAREVDAALLREQFDRVQGMMLMAMLPVLLLGAIHIGTIPADRLLVWVALMAAILLLRRRNARRMLLQPAPAADGYRRKYLIEWGGTVAAGLGWGSCMWLLSNGQIDALFYFRLMFLAGVCAISLGITGMSPRIYGSFLSAMLLATTGIVYTDVSSEPGALAMFVGLLMVFFGLLMSRSVADSRLARERIEARMNQALLVQRLREVVLEQQGIQLSLEAKSAALERSNILLNELAIHDTLTGVYNRGHVQELLRQSVVRYNRYHRALCVMLIDLDHFKRVNDDHGHAVGDDVLRQISAKAAACLREGDVFGRWGGEEFIALLPNLDLNGATDVAERLRLGIMELKFYSAARAFGVTVSIGVSQILGSESAESLVDRADVALYAAKDAGRNCVMLANELSRQTRPAA